MGARMFASTDPQQWPESASLIWLNSPGNPDGVVNDVGYLRAAVARARQIGALIVQDECYAELGWEGRWRSERIPSILDPRVVGGDFTGVLACYSLSKQSNMAGYRAGFVAGDARVVAGLVNVRKTAGLAVNAPVQSAMIAALGDDEHVREQKARYGRRREILLAALESTRFRVEGSSAGLYLWCTDGADAWDGVDWFAGHGILVSPGHFYGPDAARYVRISLTATDASVQEAARRLGAD